MPPVLATIHERKSQLQDPYTYLPVLIIGAGESGIATACKLKISLDFDQFRIVDRCSGIGGTWYLNQYPGVSCDIPALLYSFSFQPKKDWSTLHPSGSEIRQYLQDVCTEYNIHDKIQLNTEVQNLRWVVGDDEWEVTLAHLVSGTGDLSQSERDKKISTDGFKSVYATTEILRAKIVVSAVGTLVEPKEWPDNIPGVKEFEGEIIHTAKWKADVDFRGKDVVVVGSGSSAAQVVPQLIKSKMGAKSVTQIMRSAPWVMPNPLSSSLLDKWERYVPSLNHIPGALKALRCMIFWHLERAWFQIFRDSRYASWKRSATETSYLKYMRKSVPSEYHEMLTPNHQLGCKRRVLEGEWFWSLRESNVELTNLPLVNVQAKSVSLGHNCSVGNCTVCLNGCEGKTKMIPADIIVLANGFQTNQWQHPLRVIGREGKVLHELWEARGGPHAYLGMAVDYFPNFFMILGPNTFTGHASAIFASEAMATYATKLIGPILKGRVSAYEITEAALQDWKDRLQKALRGTVFETGGCTSWYKTERGWNSSVYPYADRGNREIDHALTSHRYSQVDFYLRCMFPVQEHWKASHRIQTKASWG